MQTITSKDNPKFKTALRLHDNRGRKQQGRIIVFGLAEIARALEAGVRFDGVFCRESDHEDALVSFAAMSGQARDSPETRFGCPIYLLPDSLFQKLSFGERGEGLIATASRPDTDLNGLSVRDDSLVLVLEAIEKPGNLGAVFRSAAGAGVSSIILADPVTDCFHPNAIRSSLGSIFAIDTYTGSSEQTKACLVKHGFTTLTTRVDTEQVYFDVDMTGRTAIVLGNEARGLSDAWSGDFVSPVLVPMNKTIDSLNIAMTATLMAYEARRQRDFAK